MRNLTKEHRKLKDLLDQARDVLVITHLSPDADGIGACLALRAALLGLGKKAHVLVADPVPNNCLFLPGLESIVTSRSALPRPSLIVSIDAGEPGLLRGAYDPEQDRDIPLVNIDHHLTNTRFGTVNIVDPEAGASCEMVYAVIKRLRQAITADIATFLLAGLVSDTQAFRTANTTAHSLRVAADLVARGAPLKLIIEEILESKPLASVRLMGLVLSQLHNTDSIVWAEITPDMLVQSGARSQDVEGISNLLNTIREAEVTVLFKVNEDGTVKISMRTKGKVNAAEVCASFGGGGHVRAAGCTIADGSPDAIKQRFLNKVRETLGSGRRTSHTTATPTAAAAG